MPKQPDQSSARLEALETQVEALTRALSSHGITRAELSRIEAVVKAERTLVTSRKVRNG